MRKNIEASERENQKHLRGPHADAFDLDQGFNHFLVGEPRERVEAKASIRDAFGQIVEVLRLLRRVRRPDEVLRDSAAADSLQKFDPVQLVAFSRA